MEQIQIHPVCVICVEKSSTRGNVTIMPKNVIHPWVTIETKGDNGSILINEGNLIEEKTLIQADNHEMTIGQNNWFHVGSQCLASSIGNGCILESGSYLGSNASISDNCIIGAGCKFDPTEKECLPEGTIIQATGRSKLHQSRVNYNIEQRNYMAKLLSNIHELRR